MHKTNCMQSIENISIWEVFNSNIFVFKKLKQVCAIWYQASLCVQQTTLNANSGDPDDVLQNVAFHLDPHCLLGTC